MSADEQAQLERSAERLRAAGDRLQLATASS
jgi:hypothetical protein